MVGMGSFPICNKAVTLCSYYQSQPSILQKSYHRICQKRPCESSLHRLIPTSIKYPYRFFSDTNNKFRVNSVRDSNGDQTIMSVSSAYQVLDIMPDCTLSNIKGAFCAKVCLYYFFSVIPWLYSHCSIRLRSICKYIWSLIRFFWSALVS